MPTFITVAYSKVSLQEIVKTLEEAEIEVYYDIESFNFFAQVKDGRSIIAIGGMDKILKLIKERT